MPIKETGYYLECTAFLRRMPEAEFVTFCETGFSYINSALGIAIALARTSKSNYDVTIIYAGECATITEHNVQKACERVRYGIENAKKEAY